MLDKSRRLPNLSSAGSFPALQNLRISEVQTAQPSRPRRNPQSPAPGGLLGIDAKLVDNGDAKAVARLSKWASKRTAATLLKPHDPKLASRISCCGYAASRSPLRDGSVSLVVRDGSAGRTAYFSGLQTCGSVWACPICSAKVAQDRAVELNALLSWARAAGHTVAMLTLTVRHGRRDALPALLAALKASVKSFRQSRPWRSLGVVGSVTATEVTDGQNGWHPHLHLLVIGGASLGADLERLRPEWLRSLKKQGLSGNGHAFQVQDASAAGQYVAKFGAAEELALSTKKIGRADSLSPWQLLELARDGDAQAAARWVEFALAFKGRNQLVWSRGLRALSGADRAADEAQAEADAKASVPVVLRSWLGLGDDWRFARRRRCALINAALAGGDIDAAEFGPSDAERWRRHIAEGEVIERCQEVRQ